MEIPFLITAVSLEIAISIELDTSNFIQKATVNLVCTRVEATDNLFDLVKISSRTRAVLKSEPLFEIFVSDNVSASQASCQTLAAKERCLLL